MVQPGRPAEFVRLVAAEFPSAGGNSILSAYHFPAKKPPESGRNPMEKGQAL
jgi:hypothetical protein